MIEIIETALNELVIRFQRMQQGVPLICDYFVGGLMSEAEGPSRASLGGAQRNLVGRAVAAPQTFRPDRLKRRQRCGAWGIIFRTGRWRQSGSSFLSRYLSRCSREGSRPRRKGL